MPNSVIVARLLSKLVRTSAITNGLIEGETFRIGGSPSSKSGVVSLEYEKMSKWRGSHESGEFHSAKHRLEVMDAEDTLISVNYPTLLLQWPVAKDPKLNQALTRSL